MSVFEASACAKLILCGEHAVVYGRPAIALPVASIRAIARVQFTGSGGISLHALDQERSWLVEPGTSDSFGELVLHTLTALAIHGPHHLRIEMTSQIPIASGMGSGAAVATAIVRALAAAAGRELSPEQVSTLVYESERRFHGTPSGIDNTVVAFERPIWFVRATAPDGTLMPTIEPVTISAPFTLLVGDTGQRSATRLPVGEVRRRWQASPKRYDERFDQVAALVHQARAALAHGDQGVLGAILSENHTLLKQIGVSNQALNRLVQAALDAGALGAKLSGAGWGGVMFALVTPATHAAVAEALLQAGAVRVLEAQVAESEA